MSSNFIYNSVGSIDEVRRAVLCIVMLRVLML